MHVDLLNQLAKKHNEGLTHFFVNSEVITSKIDGNSRISLQIIQPGQLIAIIGGVIVDKLDSFIAMPIGTGIFIHQVSNSHKGTVNHSCDPNCRIEGFNKLVARRQIQLNEELTVDYGTISIGSGTVIIEKCKCGCALCRHIIKTDDFKILPDTELSIYGKYMKENNI